MMTRRSRARLRAAYLSLLAAVSATGAIAAVIPAIGLILLAPSVAAPQEVPATDEAGRFTIHFENVELPTFIKFISKVTGRKFVYSERVGGPVTVISPVPVTEKEALALFESVLSVRGLTTISGGTVTRIVPLKEALTSGGTVSSDGGPGEGFATRLFPLEHVQADEIQTVLEPLVSKEGALVAYPATNTLVVSDVSPNLERIAHVVSALDIASHEESVEVIQLHHADAATLAGQLAEILTSPRERPQRGAGKEKQQQQLGSPREPFKIVPDERTNSLIVVAGTVDARRVRTLATSLDRPLQPGDQRINVYYARYADAVQLVDVINTMLTGQRRGPTRAESKTSARDSASARTSQAAGASATGAQTTGAQQTTSVSSDVRLSADPSTNSVIIDAAQQDYRMIRSLLESLDIQRPQVFVEAILAEVSMNKTKELGIEWQVGGTVGDATILARTALSALNPALTDPSSLSGLIAAAVSDKTIELPDGTEIPANVALVRALESDGDINVLSAPTLLTLDNQEAKIVVGQNVPFVTSQGVDLASVNNVFTTVERQDVGIKLTLTPQVAEGDVVILQVEEEVSALVDNPQLDANTVGPTTTIRSAQTTVSVQDGHTAVIGGLISNAVQRRASKVPFLGDIPWLGRLFRTDANRDEKVNLIAFLTPHVIRNSEDLRRVSEARRANFHESRPEVSVPFPAGSEQPYVIPGKPDAPPGPAGLEMPSQPGSPAPGTTEGAVPRS